MIFGEKEMQRVEQLKHNEEILFKMVDYLSDMFAKNNVSYFEEIEIYTKKLGLNGEDLEYLGIKDKQLEDRAFYDKCYNLLYNYTLKTSDKDLKELYDWYDVEYGAETSLCNIMFESLCNNYDKDKLEEEIKKIVGEH
jgi:hypothetical protein